MDRKRIAQIIRTTRHGHKLSQSEFATALSFHLPKKIKKQDISKWENDRTSPEYWLVYALCTVRNGAPQPWVITMAKEIFDLMNY